MSHPELGPIAILTSLLPLIALPAQIRARSIPTIALVFWLFTVGITRGINAIVWEDNTTVRLVAWCDIVTRLHHAFSVGVPGAALCIMIQLESIASTRVAGSSIEDKRRKKIFEIFMCFGLPLLSLILYYTVEGHRFDIWESFGCYPTYVVTVPTLLFVWLPPLIITSVSMVYGSLVLYHFIRHKMSFTQYLSSSRSSISVSRYIRLMSLSSIEICWELAANIYILQYNLSLGLGPYNWTDVHFDFSRIGRWPRFMVPDDIFQAFLVQWWIVPAACMAFFLFFGTGEEAMKDYRFVYRWIMKNVFRITIKDERSQFLPTYSTTSRGTVKTAVATPNSSKGGRKPWEDISINLPTISTSDDDDSLYKGSDASPITPSEKTENVENAANSRFSHGSEIGITISELRHDTRPAYPASRPVTPTPVAVTTPPVSAVAQPAATSPTHSETLHFGDVKITIERQVS